MFQASNTNYFKPPVGAELQRNHPLERGLFQCYIFNQKDSTFALDLANNLNGNFINGAQIVPTQKFTVANISGANNQGINIPGTYGNLDFNAPITVACLYKVRSIAAYQYLVNRWRFNGGGTAHRMWSLDIDGSGNIIWRASSDGTDSGVSSATFAGNTNVWISVVGTYDKINLKLYINGNLKTTTAATFNFITTTSGEQTQIGIGDNLNNSPINGQIAYVYIWQRALNPAEIYWLYREPYSFIKVPTYKRYFFSGTVPVVVNVTTDMWHPNIEQPYSDKWGVVDY